MLSLLIPPKVIQLSSGHCITELNCIELSNFYLLDVLVLLVGVGEPAMALEVC